MLVMSGAIAVSVDPTIEIGPLSLAWHGLTIAVGITAGAALARREAKRLGLDSEPLEVMALILIAASIVGARVFHLAENGLLSTPGEWLATTGFTFYGGFIGAAVAVGAYIWRRRLSLHYVDAIAAAVPIGIALGRIGDVINGEHYGPPTDSVLGVQRASRGIDTGSDGGLPLRRPLRGPARAPHIRRGLAPYVIGFGARGRCCGS